MLQLAALTALFSLGLQDPVPAQALRDYASGASALRPELSGLDWKTVRRLLEEREYPAPALGKECSRSHTLANGHEATFFYYVPESYDARKPTPLAFYLHGAVSGATPRRGKGKWQVWRQEADQLGWIVCAPSGTRDALWWQATGEEQILEALRFLSASFNIDRNRVFASGFSDGASGVYGLGMRLTDLWAACIPWNGTVGVISSPRAGNSPFYTSNCRGTSWRATHGGKDPLYPSASQKLVVERFKEAGVDIEWRDFEDLGHDADKIIPADREFIDAWILKRKRDPLPKEIDWTTHEPGRYGRAFWIRVLELGERPGNPFAGEKDLTIALGGGELQRPVLGVQIDQNFRGPGLRIEQVTIGAGAAQAGVKHGDILVAAEGCQLKSFGDLQAVLGKVQSGEAVKLAIARGDQELELVVPFRPLEQPKVPAVPKAGRLRAIRSGNRIEVQSFRIARFEILVSPDAFELAQEICVTVNGQVVFKQIVPADAGVLLDEARCRGGDLSAVFVARVIIGDPLLQYRTGN